MDEGAVGSVGYICLLAAAPTNREKLYERAH